jgi:hypothetical protein
MGPIGSGGRGNNALVNSGKGMILILKQNVHTQMPETKRNAHLFSYHDPPNPPNLELYAGLPLHA